jgi:hypothetical protein
VRRWLKEIIIKGGTKKMEKQNTWLDEEAKQLTEHKNYEELPSLKLVPNVVAELTIDFSKPFDKWVGENQGKSVTKRIIPITLNGTKMVWWLNVKNPIYREIITLGMTGKNVIKVLQTGTQANTKYVLVK